MRLIDADAGVDYLQMMAQNCRNFGMYNTAVCYDMLVSLLGDTGHFPTIDAVPVVRCKDCSESEECPVAGNDCLYCGVWDTIVRCNGYCDHGAKMDGGEDDA